MGTHRSRHNKGRKPFYKDHRRVAADLIARPMYPDMCGSGRNGWYSTRTWWSEVDRCKVEILCEADSDIEASADALGRAPSTIAWQARELGLTLPGQWAKIIAPKNKRPRIERTSPLAYPYIVKPRPEHADLLAINAIIPKSIPDDMRADMCQEIMVALLEGRTTIDVLKSRDKSAAYFMRKFYKDNYEDSGRALSFSPIDDDKRSYDEIASAIAAKEWHADQFYERGKAQTEFRRFTPAVQFEAAWNDQVRRRQIALDQIGQFLSHDEVAELLDAED